MFSAVAVDIESNILVLKDEASGCKVLTVEKKSDTQSQTIVLTLLIAFLCRFKEFAFLKIYENGFLMNNRIHRIVH